MSRLHQVYLNLGSNIEPEINLVRAIQRLQKYGEIKKVSTAWESEIVGAKGPNFLNACALFISRHTQIQLKEEVIDPVETQLGRVRGANKHAPRTIDIDIVLFDDKTYDDKVWNFAFVIIPLAEIYPDYQNPVIGEKVSETATRLRREVWMEARPEVLSQYNRGSFKFQN